MTASVAREGNHAIKPVKEPGRVPGEIIALRSQLLSQWGVHTPVGRHQPSTDTLVFPWIEGVSGRELLRRHFDETPSRTWNAMPRTLLNRCLTPMVALHNAHPTSLVLSWLNPWRQTRIRLMRFERAVLEEEEREILERVKNLYQTLEPLVSRRISACRTAPVVVHGDFHVGQLLFEKGTEDPWLLDLDDLALGPPESDLGNLIAHLVTSEDFRTKNIQGGFEKLAELLADLYCEVGGTKIKARKTYAYGVAGLVRRSLKLWENGDSVEHIGHILSIADIMATQQVRSGPAKNE